MKKLSLLVGTLGGAMAGYLFSNKKLREQLASAKDAEEAAKLLGKHLQKDGKSLAKQARDFVQSDDVQKNISKAKKYATGKVREAKKELKGLVEETATTTKKAAKRSVKKAKKAVKSAGKVKTSTRKLK